MSWERHVLLVVGLAMAVAACDGSPEARRGRIYDLKESADPQRADRIRPYLGDESADVRATALHALVALEVPDASALAVRALDDPDSFVRTIAARALEDLADPAAASALAARLVEDEDWRVRRAAADALPRAGGEEAVAALTAGLEDPVKEVRLGAVRGLGKLAPDAGFELLCRMMIEDPEWEVRVQVAAVLGGAGRPEATPVLEQASRDPNEFVRAAVAKALRTGRQEPAPGPSE